MTRRSAAAALALGSALLLAACSGDGEAAPGATPDARPSTTTPEVDEGRVSPPDLDPVPSLTDAVGARGDLSGAACTASPGGQSVTGQVHNGGSDRADYLVVVSWTNEHADVLARAHQLVESLEAGATARTDIEVEVPAGATGCTVNVRRATAGD